MSYAERTRPPKILTEREVKKLLKVVGEHKRGFRDRLILSFALGMGLRQSEIVGLDVLDVSNDGLKPKRSIQLKIFKRAAAGASPDDHRCHVPDATYHLLEKFLRSEWHDRRPSEGTPLFVSREGHRLSVQRVRAMFKTWQARAGLDQRYNFHALRHTAVSGVWDKTGDLRIAQRFARHANIGTTVRYTHPSDEKIAAAVKDVIA